ncbi:leucyl aminopeptidase family protein [Cognatiyoonia sp. IB215182]|uniref:leucyl aminopeptidase family protein n=1 Tax=Cognatiyoonia sp. IB215182 TaxID=3097353 RepID=UPI002A16EE78|nr:leucyl aminopeptidase family protein [Cognatiyoonia sp. IB215182]MDX8352789.1 leucyl aminopeptidase family protein [Cognatiyoonia sp. IB215182]
MLLAFADETDDAIPLNVISADALDKALDRLPSSARNWVKGQGFSAGLGEFVLIPDAEGQVSEGLIGFGTEAKRARGRFHLGAVAKALPKGTYRIASGLEGSDLEEAALAWLLAGYSFDQYRKPAQPIAGLVAPEGVDAERLAIIANGEALTRDLINTPASDMGPDELEQAVRRVASDHDAAINVITGDDLLSSNFPMIHTVGRASTRAPRLLDLRWGQAGPQLTLVGKGVCFDTGGLNLKPGSSMALMKKDMGGAATVLGLAQMIMALRLPLRLRVLIPAVENSIDGNAFRPQDILTSRKGLTVEINNTDAEGRLVLADALTLSDEDAPDLVISMATLTGAARVAVGPDLSPFYTDSNDDAAALSKSGDAVADPVWRMPFHTPYEAMIEPGIADLDNAPKGGFAGSITAALFLRRFVESRYVHFDIYGWQPSAAPSRPKGGVGMGARAILEALPELLNL